MLYRAAFGLLVQFMRRRLFRRFWRWGREVVPTLALALPIMGGLVGHMLLGLADTMMVGRVGVVPLAASAFVNTLFHLPMVFGIGLLSSVPVLTARAFGSQQSQEAGEVLRHGLWLSLVGGMVLALGLVALRPCLGWFGQPSEVVVESGPYLLLVGASLVPLLLQHAAKQFSEALSRPWPPMLIMLGGVLLNILLNWILIYGHWGAPALGLKGAGWATLLARLAMALTTAWYVTRARALRPFQPPRWQAKLARSRLRALWNLGWPVAVQHLLEVSAFSTAAIMMGWISAQALAAHQIAITCASATFMFPLGLGMAVCIRVGQAWGAGRQTRMRRIGIVGLGMAVLVMGVFAVLLMVAGEFIARQFVHAPPVVRLAARLLFVAGIFQVADGLQVVALSALRGLADVRIPALVAVLAYWILAVPLAYVLTFPAQLGAVGIWIGLAVGLGTAAASLVWRFHRKSLPAQLQLRDPSRSQL